MESKREAGWYWVLWSVEDGWQCREWKGDRWSNCSPDFEFIQIGPRIPEPTELAASITLRDRIDAEKLEAAAGLLRADDWHVTAQRLLDIAALRRAATPPAQQGGMGGEIDAQRYQCHFPRWRVQGHIENLPWKTRNLPD